MKIVKLNSYLSLLLVLAWLALTGCAQMAVLKSPVGLQGCENVHVLDERAVQKNGLAYIDPVMGQGIIEFSPSLADATASNICAGLNEKGISSQVHFKITDLQCSGTNGLIEGFLQLENGSAEKRIRSTAVAADSGVLIATICGSAINNAMPNLVAEVVASISANE